MHGYRVNRGQRKRKRVSVDIRPSMEIKMKSKRLAALAFAAASTALATLWSVPASAGVTYYTPVTTFHDDNLDFVYDTGRDNVGTLGVGDRLISVFSFQNTLGIFAGQGPSGFGGDQITGIADVTITAVLGNGTLVFAPTGATGLLGSFAAGTAVAVYKGAAGVLDVLNSNCGTQAQCITKAQNGSLYLTAGFFGDLDSSWTSAPAAGGGTIATVQNGNSSNSFGTFNFNLSIGVNNTGVKFQTTRPCAPFCGVGGDGFVDLVGNGQILGGAGLTATEWTARSKTNFEVSPIPEPMSVALMGVGLLAMGGASIRRKSRS